MLETSEQSPNYTKRHPARQTLFAVVLATGILLAVGVPGAAAAPCVTAGRVTARLALASTRLRTGTTVHGHLVLTNSGDLPVDLNQGCTPEWDVVLGKGTKPPGVAFAQICGDEAFVVKPGTTKLPFSLAVGKRPPGHYRAFLVAGDPSFPNARPVKVTVVSATSK